MQIKNSKSILVENYLTYKTAWDYVHLLTTSGQRLQMTYFEEIKVDLWDYLAVCVSVSVSSPNNFWMPTPIFMKLGM